jgi:hypothetical protein
MIHPLFYFSSRRHLRQIGIINGGVYSIYLIIKTVSGQVNSDWLVIPAQLNRVPSRKFYMGRPQGRGILVKASKIEIRINKGRVFILTSDS